MARGAREARKQIAELFEGRPGWRLEPRTTPGATPLWCFVADGKVVFSVTAEGGSVRLYDMGSDRETVFADVHELTSWLRAYRSDALQDVPPRPDGRTRAKKFFEWG
ncbi:MAG TPA: hypothetical protein VIX84_07870 [Acidimicrobiales bacterium]|jgi:hypothetical protein